MKRFNGLLIIVFAVLVSAAGVLARQSGSNTPRAEGLPDWAYAITPANQPAPPQSAPDTGMKTIPGSTLSFTLSQIRDGFGPADWFPGDHPTMPDVVAKGRRPDVRACGLCHYPNGKGRPENAGIAGLPVSYFIQQMHDFKNDLRKTSEPRKTNTGLMATIAKGMTEDEIKASAEYFAAMKWTPWIRVVETSTVPKMRIQGGVHFPIEGAGTEPIGMRIVETPESIERSDLRDPRSGWIAYAPPGSIKKGEALANGGGGKTVACTICHGPGLKGLGPVPGLAGRSPSYSARQLFDMKHGVRKGAWTDLMKGVVANLTNEDLVAISAYTASLAP